MKSITPGDIASRQFHQYMLGAVGPRPIAFASTLDSKGRPNLSPFSYFNVFSTNPPILVFSSSRRGRDNSIKHTHENLQEVKEVVINIVNYDIVQQMSLSSTEYAREVNEFEKAGLSMLSSELVKPFRVAESPVQFECKVNEIIALGEQGGAGNMMICEVLKMHINEEVLDEDGLIDQHKIDQVARMGGNWYSRANLGMFEVPKPLSKLGIGVDQIPQEIRNSEVLTGNDLGKLGNTEALPSKEEIDNYLKESPKLAAAVAKEDFKEIHKQAKVLIEENKLNEAWKILLAK